MEFSNFGNKFTQKSGILQLMADLGEAMSSDKPVNMLGGGNPARIDEVNEMFLQSMKRLTGSHEDRSEFNINDNEAINNFCSYSSPQGDAEFINSLVEFFNRHYDWGLTSKNIALVNGSQNGFFCLFNMFSGKFADGDKSILLPLAPEYVGYADVHIDGKHFVAVEPIITEVTHENKEGFFKYNIDFDKLENLSELQEGKIGAICCSRPTNPTGNVLTDAEMERLSQLAQRYNIPLIVDNAYGMPFPNIIYPDVKLKWDENTILCASLSKLGLPSVRTGIVVAHEKVIETISSMNAIVNLAPTRFGAGLVNPLVQNDDIKKISDNTIKPFYKAKAERAVQLLQDNLNDLVNPQTHEPVLRIHKPEGAIFLWLWFKDLPITSDELYSRLKEKGTLIIPSQEFFTGMDITHYAHARQCIRMSIAPDDETLVKGITDIAETVKEVYRNNK